MLTNLQLGLRLKKVASKQDVNVVRNKGLRFGTICTVQFSIYTLKREWYSNRAVHITRAAWAELSDQPAVLLPDGRGREQSSGYRSTCLLLHSVLPDEPGPLWAVT